MDAHVINPDAIYTLKEACRAVGFGRTFLRGQIKEGKLNAKRAGKRIVKIKGEDLIKWFDALPSALPGTPSSGEDEKTDGKPSGKKTAEQKGLASALLTTNR